MKAIAYVMFISALCLSIAAEAQEPSAAGSLLGTKTPTPRQPSSLVPESLSGIAFMAS